MAVVDHGAPDETPQPKEAADAALELLKQIITLASGLIAVSAAFSDKFISGRRADWLLPLSWLFLGISILTALQGMSAIIKSRLTPEFKWFEGTGRNMARASRVAFVLGVLSFGVFAFVEGRAVRPKGNEPAEATIKVFSRVEKEYAIIDSATVTLTRAK